MPMLWYDLSELRFFLENSFGRITLVNHAMTERVTIDLNLYFHNLQTGCDSNLSRLAVIELKRNGRMESPDGRYYVRLACKALWI